MAKIQIKNSFITSSAQITISSSLVRFESAVRAKSFTGSFSGSVTATNIVGTTNYIPKFTGTTSIGNSAMYDSSGNIGIGTTSPSAKLHSFATAEQLRLGYDANNYASFLVSSNGTLILSSTNGTSTADINISPQRNLNLGTSNTDNIYIGRTDLLTGTYVRGIFSVTTTGSIQGLYQDNTGNVGIGTSSPSAKLHVSGSSATSIIDGLRIGRGAGNIITNTVVGNTALVANTTGAKNSAFGYFALWNNTSGIRNNAFGYFTLLSNTIGNNNAGFGHRVLRNNTAGANNSGFGYNALYNNTTGARNNAFGVNSLLANVTGVNNNAFGFYALKNNTTNSNNAFGAYALASNTTGNQNSAFGHLSLKNNTSGLANNAFGAYALASNTVGVSNSAFGSAALFANTIGLRNNAFGLSALRLNTTNNNNAFGYYALRNNTTGIRNSAFGHSALRNNTISSSNSAFGYKALYTNTGKDNSAFGSYALASNTTGVQNSAFGHLTLLNNTIGQGNSAFGYIALASNTTGNVNSAFGVGALRRNTSGVRNNAFGGNALQYNLIGNRNNAFGFYALSKHTGDNNNAFGYLALASNTTGNRNSAFGNQALYQNTSGRLNSAFGYFALRLNKTGGANTAFGNKALNNNSSGNRSNAFGAYALLNNTTNNNNAFGYLALASNTTGIQNSAFGHQALQANTIGIANSAFGYNSLVNNTSGTYNVAIGTQTLFSNTSGKSNTAVGLNAMYYNVTGFSNNALGMQSLYLNQTGNSNNAFGYRALRANTTNNNNAFGTYALASNTTGANNSAFGHQALKNNTIGNQNSAFGYFALSSNTTGNDNNAFGYGALGTLTSGQRNIAIGVDAGDNITTGNSNIIIGHNIDAPIAAGSNQLNIANLIFGSGSAFGQGTQISTGSNVGIGTTSPSYKLDVNGSINANNIRTTTQIGSTSGTIQSFITPGIYSNGSSTGNAIAITSNTSFANQGAWANLGLHQTTANANDLTAKVYLSVGGWYQNGGTGIPVYIGGGFTSNSSSVLSVVPSNASGNGSVGIGTTSPSSILHLSSTGPTILTIEADTDNITETDNARIILKQDGGLVVGRMGYASGGNSLEITNEYPDHIVLGTNNTERVRIDLNGNVGIGTSSPVQKFHIDGAVGNPATTGTSQNGIIRISNTNDNAVLDIGIRSGGAGAWLQSTDETSLSANYPLLLNPNGGNVGIGTTSPTGRLEVSGSSNASILKLYRNAASATTPLFYAVEANGSPGKANVGLFERLNNLTAANVSASSAGVRIREHSSNYALSVEDHSGNSLLVVKGNGSVGIGTTSPAYPLEVNGSLYATRVSGSNMFTTNGKGRFFGTASYALASAGGGATVSGTTNYIAKFTSTTAVGNSIIFETGSKIGIGTTNPSSKLEVSGSLTDYATFNRRTGNYTMSLSDASKLIEMNVATANTVNVPTNAQVAFKVGTKVDIVQYGAGQTTITGSFGSGVQLRTANGWAKINARYGVASLVKVGTNEWYMFGNLSA